MRAFRTVYRGYAIYLSGADSSWSFHAEPIRPDLPILSECVSNGHRSWGKALRKAKRQIDRLLGGIFSE
jgi:hypothetical protein